MEDIKYKENIGEFKELIKSCELWEKAYKNYDFDMMKKQFENITNNLERPESHDKLIEYAKVIQMQHQLLAEKIKSGQGDRLTDLEIDLSKKLVKHEEIKESFANRTRKILNY